ncbi:TPA: acyltransferase family protein [Escherichia coli]
MNYRADIDALRTFAVLAVVIFHFNGSLLPGGFAGVDVFFAISGYLMTGIIISGIKKDTFTIAKFYLSRAKRIIPALSVLCLLLMLYGWFKLPPLDYSALSKHVFSSLLFVSNFVYWGEAGYFDAESHHKWLLHTWSLSAEWQFYIIYPFIIIAFKKLLRDGWVGLALIALAVVSYVFSIYSSTVWPTASYFLLPSRAWEMFAGGVAYCYAINSKSKKSIAMHYTGLALIVCSYFIVSSQDLWPGYMTLLPVLGACLYLSANHQGLLSRFTPAIMVGKWSYSIYLWHWPVVVYCTINNISINIWLGLAFSVMLGLLSYQIVEKRRSAKLLTFTPFAATASFIVAISNGYAYQMPKEVYNATMLDPNSKEFGQYTWKNIREVNSEFTGNGRKILVIGDSTAGDFLNILFELKKNSTNQIRSRLINAKCGSFYLNENQRENYFKISPDIINGLVSKGACNYEIGKLYNDQAVKQADVIIVSMNWRGYALDSLKQSLENLKNTTAAPVYIVGSKGFSDSVPDIIYGAYSHNEDIRKLAYKKSIYQIKINDSIRNITKAFLNVYFIDLKSTMCDVNKQECVVTNDKNPILYDSLHSTHHGVSYMAKKLSDQLINL